MLKPLMAIYNNPPDTSLDQAKDSINERTKTLFKIHHAVPRSLPRTFNATHFVRTILSPEDANFLCAVKLVQKCFREELDDNFPELFPTASKSPTSVTICIRSHYDLLLRYSPAHFAFGCESAILSLLTRRVTDDLGHVPGLDEALGSFKEQFRKSFPTVYKGFLARLREELRGSARDDVRTGEVGGIRQWLEGHAREGNPSEVEGALDDFKHLYLKSFASDHFVTSNVRYQLRWTRLPQGWTYTFIEPLMTTYEKAPIPTDSLESWRKRYLSYLSGLIISFAIDPNVMNAAALPAVPDNIWFPGATLAGAHYLMLGVDGLIALSLAWPNILSQYDAGPGAEGQLRQRIKNYIQALRKTDEDTGLQGDILDIRISRFIQSMDQGGPDRIAAAGFVFSICLKILGQDQILELLNWHTMSNSLKTKIKNILESSVPHDRRDMTIYDFRGHELAREVSYAGAALSDLNIFGFIKTMITTSIESENVSNSQKETVLKALTELVRCFWESAIGWDAKSLMNDVDDDYVAAAMVDFRCLYFSNFIPVGRELFTRTIFLDVGMGSYQRGRMLQRLCDILMYRSLAIRDVDRVQAAIEGFLEISRTLNDIQSTLVGTINPAGFEEAVFLQDQLARVMDMAGRTGQMNSFLTYGILGRQASSRSYMEQILERCDDVRERRLPNYPMLKDFVERRIGHQVRHYDRMAMHYSAIAQRITELMDMIRTRLSTAQAQEMTRQLTEQSEIAKSMNDSADKQRLAADRINQNLEAQINLQVVGEALVFIAGTFYATQIAQIFVVSMPIGLKPEGWELPIVGFFTYVVVRLIAAPVARKIYGSIYSKLRAWSG